MSETGLDIFGFMTLFVAIFGIVAFMDTGDWRKPVIGMLMAYIPMIIFIIMAASL